MKYKIDYNIGGSLSNNTIFDNFNKNLRVIKCLKKSIVQKDCSYENKDIICQPVKNYTGKCLNINDIPSNPGEKGKCEIQDDTLTSYKIYDIDIIDITKTYKPGTCATGWVSGNDFYNFNCFEPIKEKGINIVKIPSNTNLYKGMKRTRTTNLDLSNVYGNKKSWYSDFETASLYAREESDGIHVYKAQRELVLFCLNDTNNLKLLISKISEKEDKISRWINAIEIFYNFLQNFLISSLEQLLNPNLSYQDKVQTLKILDASFNSEDNGVNELLNYCNDGENWRQSKTVINNIDNIKKIFKESSELHGGALTIDGNFGPPLDFNSNMERATSSPIQRRHPIIRRNSSPNTLQRKTFQSFNTNKKIKDLIKSAKTLQDEIKIYPKILDLEKLKLLGKKEHIGFTTGYGMTWMQQIKYMVEKLIDRPTETKRYNFNFRNVNPESEFIGYDIRNTSNSKFLKFRIHDSIFGKGEYELNRISLSTDEDSKMCDIIQEFFNVDGYWSNSVVSYFHERGTFPREICIFNSRILNRDKSDPHDWVTYSNTGVIPQLPTNYEKIFYHNFSGDYDTKGIHDTLERANVPIEPLTYIFRGYKDGDSVYYNLLDI